MTRPVASGGTTEQAAAAALGYLAYSGRYFVDESTGDVRHEAKLSLVPNYLGQSICGHSDLDGDGDELRLSGRRGGVLVVGVGPRGACWCAGHGG